MSSNLVPRVSRDSKMRDPGNEVDCCPSHDKVGSTYVLGKRARRQKETTEPNIVPEEARQCLPRSTNLYRQMICFL